MYRTFGAHAHNIFFNTGPAQDTGKRTRRLGRLRIPDRRPVKAELFFNEKLSKFARGDIISRAGSALIYLSICTEHHNNTICCTFIT